MRACQNNSETSNNVSCDPVDLPTQVVLCELPKPFTCQNDFKTKNDMYSSAANDSVPWQYIIINCVQDSQNPAASLVCFHFHVVQEYMSMVICLRYDPGMEV